MVKEYSDIEDLSHELTYVIATDNDCDISLELIALKYGCKIYVDDIEKIGELQYEYTYSLDFGSNFVIRIVIESGITNGTLIKYVMYK